MWVTAPAGLSSLSRAFLKEPRSVHKNLDRFTTLDDSEAEFCSYVNARVVSIRALSGLTSRGREILASQGRICVRLGGSQDASNPRSATPEYVDTWTGSVEMKTLAILRNNTHLFILTTAKKMLIKIKSGQRFSFVHGLVSNYWTDAGLKSKRNINLYTYRHIDRKIAVIHTKFMILYLLIKV